MHTCAQIYEASFFVLRGHWAVNPQYQRIVELFARKGDPKTRAILRNIEKGGTRTGAGRLEGTSSSSSDGCSSEITPPVL
jgi:hypothetical protein